MKITCFVLCVLGLAALAVAEDGGFFVPKAFYKLDAEGHKSNVHQINPHQTNILRRLRRESVSSSSSSSSYTANGGPTYFQTSNVVQNGPSLTSRFSGFDDDDYSRPSGHAVHTTGVIENGRVVYHDIKHQNL